MLIVAAQVLGNVERVGEEHRRAVLVLLVEDVGEDAPGVRERGLERGARRGAGSLFQKREEVLAKAALDVLDHLLVGLLDGGVEAVLQDVLLGGRLAVGLERYRVRISDLLMLVLGQRDLVAGSDLVFGEGPLNGVHLDLGSGGERLRRLDAEHRHECGHALLELVGELDVENAGCGAEVCICHFSSSFRFI